jgi:hypothetical protein
MLMRILSSLILATLGLYMGSLCHSQGSRGTPTVPCYHLTAELGYNHTGRLRVLTGAGPQSKRRLT